MAFVQGASTPGTVVASLARTLLTGAARAGARPRELLQQVQLRAEQLEGPHARIPYDALTQLWQSAAEQSGDPAFGVHLAQSSIESKTFGVVGQLAGSCPTFGAGLRPIASFVPLINETTRTTLEQRSDVLIITDGHSDRRQRWPSQMAEALLAAYVVMGRQWTGRHWTPAEVHFQHERPSDLRPLQTLFGCPLFFRQTENRLLLTASVLALPLQTCAPRAAERLERLVQPLLQRAQARSLAQAVRGALRLGLLEQEPDVDFVASRLGLSTRTLQRRLRDEGTDYSQLLDGVRRDMGAGAAAGPGRLARRDQRTAALCRAAGVPARIPALGGQLPQPLPARSAGSGHGQWCSGARALVLERQHAHELAPLRSGSGLGRAGAALAGLLPEVLVCGLLRAARRSAEWATRSTSRRDPDVASWSMAMASEVKSSLLQPTAARRILM